MHDGQSAVLIADAATIERLRSEGGLRSSFLRVFHSTSVLDTASPGGDAATNELDDLLESCRLVACDAALIEHTDALGVDSDLAHKYRVNFLAKLSRRRVVVLRIVEENVDGGTAAAIAWCERTAGTVAKHADRCRCEVVLVMTSEPTPRELESLPRLRSMPSTSRIYLMGKWLQSGTEAQAVVLSEHVWPTCVARLLAARVPQSLDEPATGPCPLVAWRTFAWGTLPLTTAPLAWEADYLQVLRDELLRPVAEDSANVLSGDRISDPTEAATPATDPKHTLVEWRNPADLMRLALAATLADDTLRGVVRRTCRDAWTSTAAESPMANPTEDTKRVWAGIQTALGMSRLRALRDGRVGWKYPLAPMEARQRSSWRHITTSRSALCESRVRLEGAARELTLARSRHLPFAWRALIAALMVPFAVQFLLGLILPLRPPGGSSSDFLTPSVSAPRSVTFLIDRSSSMNGLRFDLVKKELLESIKAMADGTEFTILAFNDKLDEMPGANKNLVVSSESTRKIAIDWIESLQPEGATQAYPGLKQLVELRAAPASIVFLTDGLLPPDDRQKVDQLLSDISGKDLLKDTHIDTVMLYAPGDDESLKKLAEATQGRYRRVSYDPFEPPGFNWTLALIIAATLLGGLLGAVVPWLFEVRRGRRAAAALNAQCSILMHSYALLADQMGRFARYASRVNHARQSNRAWRSQMNLASRALRQLEVSLGTPSHTDDALSAHSTPRLRGGPLAREDRRDLHTTLDEPLPEMTSETDAAARITAVANDSLERLRNAWKTVAAEADQSQCGHLPLHDIALRMDQELADCIADASRSLLEPHHGDAAAEARWRGILSEMLDRLITKINDDSHRPFLSLRVATPTGMMPGRSLRVFLAARGDTDEGFFRQLLEQRTAAQVVSVDAVSDLGIRGMGLIHDEVPVELHRDDGCPITFVPAEGSYS